MRKNLGNIAKVLFVTIVIFGALAASWIGIDGISRNQAYVAGSRGVLTVGMDTTGSDTSRIFLTDGNGNLYVTGTLASLDSIGQLTNVSSVDSSVCMGVDTVGTDTARYILVDPDGQLFINSAWPETKAYTDTLIAGSTTASDTIPGTGTTHFPINSLVIQTDKAVEVKWFDIDGDSNTFYLNDEDDFNWPPSGYVQWDSIRITRLSADARIRRIYMSKEEAK